MFPNSRSNPANRNDNFGRKLELVEIYTIHGGVPERAAQSVAPSCNAVKNRGKAKKSLNITDYFDKKVQSDSRLGESL
jgi:hypothetical protein